MPPGYCIIGIPTEGNQNDTDKWRLEKASDLYMMIVVHSRKNPWARLEVVSEWDYLETGQEEGEKEVSEIIANNGKMLSDRERY